MYGGIGVYRGLGGGVGVCREGMGLYEGVVGSGGGVGLFKGVLGSMGGVWGSVGNV